MTDTTTPIEQAAVASPELSGVDLARLALHQARAAARKRGESEARTPRPRRPRVVQRDGREPTGVAAVLQGLMSDRAWNIPAAGGSVLDRWPDIAASVAPQLPDHVAAVAFHPETGQLDLRPDSPAYATQLRLISARIVAAANESAGTDAVRSVRVLAVGATPAPRPAPQTQTTAPDIPPAPVTTAMASTDQAVTPPSRTDPSMGEAVERQTAAMRALSLRAFPEPVANGQPDPIEQARTERRRQADLSHAAALRRARAERAANARAATTPQGRSGHPASSSGRAL